MKLTKRIAPKLKIGCCIPKTSSLHPLAARKVENEARKLNCSKSFIIASIVATYYEVYGEGRYDA